MKYIRKTSILLITILIFYFLFHVLITNFSLKESSEIEQLRETVKITFK